MVSYNIFFHPLAKFPGPALAAASYIPYARHQADGSFSVWVKELHEQYKSEIIRISPNEVSFIGVEAWKDISGYRVGHRPFEHDAAVYGRAVNGVDNLLTAKKVDHSRMRRVLDHAFSTKALREQSPIILGYVDSLIEGVYEQAVGTSGGKLDLAQRYSWMSFDLIGTCPPFYSRFLHHSHLHVVLSSTGSSQLMTIFQVIWHSENLSNASSMKEIIHGCRWSSAISKVSSSRMH